MDISNRNCCLQNSKEYHKLLAISTKAEDYERIQLFKIYVRHYQKPLRNLSNVHTDLYYDWNLIKYTIENSQQKVFMNSISL